MSARILPVVLALVVSALPVASGMAEAGTLTTTSAPSYDLFAVARDDLAHGRFERAISQLTALRVAEPDRWEIETNLGLAWLGLHRERAAYRPSPGPAAMGEAPSGYYPQPALTPGELGATLARPFSFAAELPERKGGAPGPSMDPAEVVAVDALAQASACLEAAYTRNPTEPATRLNLLTVRTEQAAAAHTPDVLTTYGAARDTAEALRGAMWTWKDAADRDLAWLALGRFEYVVGELGASAAVRREHALNAFGHVREDGAWRDVAAYDRAMVRTLAVSATEDDVAAGQAALLDLAVSDGLVPTLAEKARSLGGTGAQWPDVGDYRAYGRGIGFQPSTPTNIDRGGANVNGHLTVQFYGDHGVHVVLGQETRLDWEAGRVNPTEPADADGLERDPLPTDPPEERTPPSPDWTIYF